MAIYGSVTDKTVNRASRSEIDDQPPCEGLEADPEPGERKATLDDLLALMRNADDAIDDLDIDLESLGSELRNKVDGITEYIDYCDARATAIRPRAAMLAKKAQSFEKRAKQLREYVAFCMHADAVTRGNPSDEKQRLPGDNYEFRLCYSETVEPIRDPDAQLYLKLKGQFLRRSYAWDKAALKRALKDGNEEIAAFATIKKSPYVKITPKS